MYSLAPWGLFVVEADSPEGAAEVAFQIANSYPDEMHCAERYAGEVRQYRRGRNRSLSVGDVVHVQETGGTPGQWGLYSVASAGFERVA
jgi:hypothetical protein